MFHVVVQVASEPRTIIDIDDVGHLWFFVRVPYDRVDDARWVSIAGPLLKPHSPVFGAAPHQLYARTESEHLT